MLHSVLIDIEDERIKQNLENTRTNQRDLPQERDNEHNGEGRK